MNKSKVWEIMSYSWTEIGLTDAEYFRMAKTIEFEPRDWNELDRIIFKDVCASFAVDSFLAFPLCLWMLMPDWGFDINYLRERIKRWYSKPYFVHFLNPLRLLGYPVAILFALSGRKKLKSALRKMYGA